MDLSDFEKNIHMEIHAVRRIDNYKPSPMERNISMFVIERFKDECSECKNRQEQLKNLPKKKSFFDKLGELADKGVYQI